MAYGRSSPTGHALRVFGGALGMVVGALGLFVLSAQVSAAVDGCARCRALAAGAVAALVVGALLVRSAWREMRTREEQEPPS